MADLEFTETDSPREVLVTNAELRALRRARHGLHVEEISDHLVRLGPRTGYVGTMLLPTGRRVVIWPKAKIANVPDLLALAYRTLAPPARAGIATVDDATPTDWLLLQLAGEVNELLGRGIRRGYVEQRETLPFVRGRTRPLLNPARLPLIDCDYTDFTTDTIENRLLRGVLELFAPAVRNRAVRRQLDSALASFAGVSAVRANVQSFDRVRITRLNMHYEPSLRLARLALEGAGVIDAAGAVTAPAYFVPLWRVWETAFAAALRDTGLTNVQEQPEYTDRFTQRDGIPKLRVTLKPDIVIGDRTKPALAIDLKWAPALQLRHGMKRLRNEHLYQLATYCSALRCNGMVVYPQMDDVVHSSYEFNGRKLTLRTVNLATSQLSDLRTLANDIATKVAVPGQ